MIINEKTGNIFYDETLPRWESGKNKGCINWKETIGCIVKIIYESKEYNFEILDYYKSKKALEVKINDNIKTISVGKLLICRLDVLFDKYSSDFKIKIGDTIEDERRNLYIIDREYRNKQFIDKNGYKCVKKDKWYLYKCRCCNNKNWMVEYYLCSKKVGCNVCGTAPKKVTEYNCLANTNPELMPYLMNASDGYNYTANSNKKINCICPICKTSKSMALNNLRCQGFSCKVCGDGVSYPEKFICILLDSVNVEYITQLSKITFNWCDNYRYDIYIPKYNLIIEVQGIQHYEENTNFKMSLLEVQKNDILKEQLAKINGIDKYIKLDCRISSLIWIKNSLLNSELKQIIDLSNIDWKNVDAKSHSSKVIEACDIKRNNPNISTVEIGKLLNVTSSTVVKYLKIGHIHNWCYYNPNEERDKPLFNYLNQSKRRISIYKDGEQVFKIFDSITELCEEILILTKIKLDASCISKVCRGKLKQHKGYTFKYIN